MASPQRTCDVCQEANGFPCGNCGVSMCAGCFEHRLRHHAALGWQDRSATSSLANLTCDYCDGGGFHPNILLLLSPHGAHLHRTVLRLQGRAEAQTQRNGQEANQLAQFRGLPSVNEMLYDSCKTALLDLVSAKTPCCQRRIANVHGYMGKKCDFCEIHFCGLCCTAFAGRFACHQHVAQCPQRPFGMVDEHFLSPEGWQHHNASRQRALVVAWLNTKAFLPDVVKARLLQDFPTPA